MAKIEQLLPEASFDRESAAWGIYSGCAPEGVIRKRYSDEDLPVYRLGTNMKPLHV
jgi:hypothetical protein